MLILGRISFTLIVGLTWISVEAGFAPPLPTGRRTQYYYIYDDGAYKYGYDTGDGSYGKAVASPDNEVQGDYAYQGPGGKVDVKYTAGKAGFLPNGLPHSNGGVHVKSGSTSPSVYGHHATPVEHSTKQGYAVNAAEEEPGDASYSFAYNADGQSRQEVSDTQGNIHGSYSYIAKDGATKKVDYEAGAEKGFIVKGDATNGGISNADGSYSFSYNAGDHARQESSDANGNVVGSFSFTAKDDGLNRQVNYEAGAERGFIARGSHLPQAPTDQSSPAGGGQQNHATVVDSVYSQRAYNPVTSHSGPSNAAVGVNTVTVGPSPARAYSFSYNAGDHTRHETSDANGNVIGSFSFVAKDDKINRKVDYESTPSKGFIAYGSHLPVAPSYITSANSGAQATFAQQQPHIQAPQQPHFKSNINQQPGIPGVAPDGSYSFSYDAGDHSRTESADANGNVIGSFSFVAKDNVQRKLDYEAGAERGFIARGDHLPDVPSSSSAVTTAYDAPTVTGSTFNNYYSPSTGSYETAPHQDYIPSSPGYTSSIDGTTGVSDGSYSFSYNTPDHSRQESSDRFGNVKGSFTYISKDDGAQRKVDYTAGAKQGFIPSGSHLPLQPYAAEPAVITKNTSYRQVSDVVPTYHASSDDQGNDDESGPSDASYSFSYNAGDHSRQESSDAFGNVKGSFSFVAKDDKINRKVEYESGAEKGFIAKGSHLPVPPESGTPGNTPYSAVPSSSSQGSVFNIHGSNSDGSYYHGVTGSAHHSTTGIKSKSYTDTKAKVKTFLTPNAYHKFGYIYDTQ